MHPRSAVAPSVLLFLLLSSSAVFAAQAAPESAPSLPPAVPAGRPTVGLALEGGMGYQLSPRLGAEVKAFWSPIRPDLTATGLTFGATWRF